MQRNAALNIVSAQMQAKGIPQSRWCFQNNPARISYIAQDKNGLPMAHTESFKCSWSQERIEAWLEMQVNALKDVSAQMRSYDEPESLELWRAAKE